MLQGETQITTALRSFLPVNVVVTISPEILFLCTSGISLYHRFNQLPSLHDNLLLKGVFSILISVFILSQDRICQTYRSSQWSFLQFLISY